MAKLKFGEKVEHKIEAGDVVIGNNGFYRLIIFDDTENKYLAVCLEDFYIAWSGDTLDEVNQMYGSSAMRVIKNNKLVITEE